MRQPVSRAVCCAVVRGLDHGWLAGWLAYTTKDVVESDVQSDPVDAEVGAAMDNRGQR